MTEAAAPPPAGARTAGGRTPPGTTRAGGDSQPGIRNPGDAARSKRYTASPPVAHAEPPADFHAIPSEGGY